MNKTKHKRLKFDGGGYVKHIDQWREEHQQELDELLASDPIFKQIPPAPEAEKPVPPECRRKAA